MKEKETTDELEIEEIKSEAESLISTAVAQVSESLPATETKVESESLQIAKDIRVKGLRTIRDLIATEKSIYNLNIAVRLAHDIVKSEEGEKDDRKGSGGLLSLFKNSQVNIQINKVVPRKVQK